MNTHPLDRPGLAAEHRGTNPVRAVPTGGMAPLGGPIGNASLGGPIGGGRRGDLAPVVARPSAPVSSENDSELADELAVRPFLLTGGRTRPARDDLRVESLIQSQDGVPVGSLRFEGRRIYDLCQQPASVADIAAALGVPLGVTRILVSDLIADGHVCLVENQAFSVQMLERIRDRVRAL